MVGSPHTLVIIGNWQCLPPGSFTLITPGVGVWFSEGMNRHHTVGLAEAGRPASPGGCRRRPRLRALWLGFCRSKGRSDPGNAAPRFGEEALAGPAWEILWDSDRSCSRCVVHSVSVIRSVCFVFDFLAFCYCFACRGGLRDVWYFSKIHFQRGRRRGQTLPV